MPRPVSATERETMFGSASTMQAFTRIDPSGGLQLNAIVDEVDEHLQNAIGIGIHKRNPAIQSNFQGNLFFLGGGGHHGNCLLDEVGDSDAAWFDADFSRLSPG